MTDATCIHEPNTGHPLRDLSNKLSDLVRRRRERRGLSALLDLEDHILLDIGLTRSDINAARHWPLSVDAATELRRASLERTRAHM